MTVLAEVYNWHDGNKKNLRTIEAQIVQKLENNEPRPKFTGSYKKIACVQFITSDELLMTVFLPAS